MMFGFVQRLKQGLSKTHERIHQFIDSAVGRGVLDEEAATALEEALILADVGPEAAEELIGRLKQWVQEAGGGVTAATVREALAHQIARILSEAAVTTRTPGESPAVTLIVGVNGTGKTTTAAKLAAKEKAEGRTVLLGAADTFRAAAADQLAIWADRLGVEVVAQAAGADPAAVAFDTVQAAIARKADRVIIDTAGRLHTKVNLMAELEKILRVVRKLREPEEILLVLDATTGQNGLVQIKAFAQSLPLTGLVVTKLDGTARAGVVVQAVRSFRVPVRWIGVGESVDDLLPFDASAFARELVS